MTIKQIDRARRRAVYGQRSYGIKADVRIRKQQTAALWEIAGQLAELNTAARALSPVLLPRR